MPAFAAQDSDYNFPGYVVIGAQLMQVCAVQHLYGIESNYANLTELSMSLTVLNTSRLYLIRLSEEREREREGGDNTMLR